MRRIFSVLVENRSDVLCKVAGLFSRRSFNIDSLAVGETDDHAVSLMTILSSGTEQTLEQIEKQLNKKLDVIKVKYNKGNRREIMETCEVMKAEIVDMSESQMILQICDTPEKIKLLISLLSQVSIVEVARTGTLALQKCMED